MGLFSKSKKDEGEKKSSGTHKVVTGLIIGGAVASVLGGVYATKKRKSEGEETDIELEIAPDEAGAVAVDPLEELVQVEAAEKVVAKKAVRPVRNALRLTFKILWAIIRAIFRVLMRLGKRKD